MQNTTAAGAVRLSKAKIIHAVTLIIFTAIVCRGPLMGDSFIICISLIAYMLSKNTINLYLTFPAAAVAAVHFQGMDADAVYSS